MNNLELEFTDQIKTDLKQQIPSANNYRCHFISLLLFPNGTHQDPRA